MAEAVKEALPSNQPSTALTSNFTPRITINDGRYVRVGDHSFGASGKTIDPSTPPMLLDNVRMAQVFEVQTERMIRHVLERDGLRIHKSDNWIKVMNRCKKNLYEIYRYEDNESPGWHIFRKGKLIAKISEPWVGVDGQIRFHVSA